MRDEAPHMQLAARITHKTRYRWAALAACIAFCAFAVTAISAPAQREPTLLLKPHKSILKQGEAIGMTVTFVGGTEETTLILPMGADPSGIISYSAVEIATGRKWIGSNRDARSFAADSRERIPAGGRRERHHDALEFRGQGIVPGNLPAGRYRIVVTYDERNTFRPENRTSRVLRSKPVEIVVRAR